MSWGRLWRVFLASDLCRNGEGDRWLLDSLGHSLAAWITEVTRPSDPWNVTVAFDSNIIDITTL